MSGTEQLKTLVWKNFILRYKRERLFVVELVAPLLLGPLYFFIFANIKDVVDESNTYPPNNSSFLGSQNLTDVVINYTPRSDRTDELLNQIIASGATTHGFPNLQEYLQKTPRHPALPLIMFPDLDDKAKDMPKKLRFRLLDQNYTLHLKSLKQHDTTGELFECPAIAATQKLVTEAFISYWRARKSYGGTCQLEIGLQKMNHSGILPSSQALANLFSSIIICCLVPIAVNIIRVILSERQLNVKEYMQLHNVSEVVYWLSWFLIGAFGFLMIELGFLLVLIVFQFHFKLIEMNLLILLIVAILHAANSTSISLLVASFLVNEATRTYVVIMVVPMILYLLASASMIWMTKALHTVLGLTVFHVAFFMAIKAIIDKEIAGPGYTFTNLMDAPVSDDDSCLLICLLLIVVNTMLNFFCMWYVNKVQPTHYAEQHSYLLCLQSRDNKSTKMLKDMKKQTQYMEQDPVGLTPTIQLHKVAKCSQDVVIVAETTLNIYDEQITVILGPNGPDKSALIGMITGLMLPTQGTIIICGFNVVLTRREAQECIGLCPKYDVLFDKLTCVEHLTFFYNLKGIEVDDGEVMELLVGIQLADKARTKTERLSPYEKKLLSLATATIGDPKVVILDEPSKGLSLAEQSDLWSFLKILRANRTIIVTTINVSEAEALADWTAIIIDGHVKCYGSQTFLKHNYGVGYQLHVVKKASCRSHRVTAIVLHLIPAASLQEENDNELRYYLPHHAVGKFSKLLYGLENHASLLDIESLGIYSTTMDEVFIKVQRGFDPDALTKSEEELSHFSEKKGHKQNKKFKKQKKKDKRKTEKSNKNFNTNVDNRGVSEEKLDVRRQNNYIPASGAAKHKHHKAKIGNHRYNIPDNSIISEITHSNTSISNPLSDDRTISLDAFVNMELHSKSSLSPSVDEYAFKKPYMFDPGEQSCREKMKAICIKSILVTRRRWIVTILQTGTPSLLLMAGLMLDMQSHHIDQALSYLYATDHVRGTTVRIIRSNDTPDALLDIYKQLLPTDVMCQEDEQLKPCQKNASGSSGESQQNSSSKIYIGVDFSNKLYKDGVALYSIHKDHSMAISLQLLLNSNVRSLLGHEYSVSSSLVTVEYLLHQAEKLLCPTTTLGLSLGLVIFSVVSINTLISDRRSRGKEILELYGVTPVLYWLSTFAWDMAQYTALVVCLMLIFCLDKVVFIDDGRWAVILLVLYLSAVAFMSEVYILQKLFHVQTDGILYIVTLHVFTGVCVSFALLFWEYTNTTPGYLQKYTYVLSVVLEIFSPLYNLTAAILPFPALVTVLRSRGDFKDYFQDIKFDDVVINLFRPLRTLVCQSVLCWAFILLTDSISVQQLADMSYETHPVSSVSTDPEDDDIVLVKDQVKLAVLTNSVFEATVVLQDLRKTYGKQVAVEGTCLILHKGDCFGLLGPSDSGKSTTLQLITGIQPVTSGSVFVRGYSIQDYLPKVRNMISFSPQFSILCEHLTGRETLHFYGRLRGIPDVFLHKEVDVLLNLLTLGMLADSMVLSYGASKRRLLSIAVGFLGQPVVVILDEPSYGLDTAEKIALWAVMKKVTDSQSTVFFTTQSVEECETVCTKMAIQVSGRMKCLGSPYHLKTRYARGYTIILNLHPSMCNDVFAEMLVQHMQDKFPGIAVSERNTKQLHFRIPHSGEKLYEIFHNLKTVKKRFRLENYMVHETTLEQVYLSFTLGHHVKPVKLIPKKKTVTWAEGIKDVVNTIPNKYSFYQNKKANEPKSSITTVDVGRFLKSRFSLSK